MWLVASPRNFIAVGQDHIKQISHVQSTYRVQHVNNKSKRLVVHFDRLKVCHPDTRFSGGDTEAEATSPPEKHQELHDESGQCEFGRQLELVDDFDVEMELPLNRNLTTTAQPHVAQQHAIQHPTGRRYPSRSRRPPDRYRTEYGSIPEEGELCKP